VRGKLALAASLALGACGSSDGVTEAREVVPAPAIAASTLPPCPVDPTLLPPLPRWAPPEGASAPRLVPEVIADPELGRCVEAEALLVASPAAAPVIGALRGEGRERRFSLHEVRDVALIGDGPFLLAAGASGVFLHDALTLARRARLLAEPARAVAASADGRRAAALLERGASRSRDATRSKGAANELVIFDPSTLEVIARLDDAPPGRLRFSPDGAQLVVASPDGQLFVWREGRATPYVLATAGAIADAAFAPAHPDLLAYVGERNEVQFRDLASGERVAQSGGPTLRSRRDLNAVAYVPSAGLTVAGGDDDRVHVYRGMLGERAEEIASVELEGNVEAIACCNDARFAAGTDEGQIQWFDATEPTRRLGPLVPGLLGDPIRLALYGDDVLGAYFGQLFRWTADGAVVRAPCAPGPLLLEDASEDDVLVVLRVGAKIAVHRVSGESRPSAMTEALGELAWADATRIVRSPRGERAVLGLSYQGVQVAFVDPREGLSTTVGPGMSLASGFEITAGEPGRYALWDRRGVVYELDVPGKHWRLLGHAEPGEGEVSVRYDPRRGYQAFDARDRRRAIVDAP
jgi:hypothetical protein